MDQVRGGFIKASYSRQIQRFPKTGGTARLFYGFTSASEQATDICVHKPISRSPGKKGHNCTKYN